MTGKHPLEEAAKQSDGDSMASALGDAASVEALDGEPAVERVEDYEP